MTIESQPTAAPVGNTENVLPDGFVERLVSFVDRDVSLVDEPIEAETDLLLTGAVDSLGVMTITNWIENELGFTVDATDITLDNFQTIERTVRYCRSKLG